MLLTYVVPAAFGVANNKIYAASQQGSRWPEVKQNERREERRKRENELCDFLEICGRFSLCQLQKY